MPEPMAFPKIDMAKLAFLRGLRAGLSVRIAEAERTILTAQEDRRVAMTELREAEDSVRQELRAAAVPDREVSLHLADRLVDAYLEGQATVKLGTFGTAADDAAQREATITTLLEGQG